MSAEHQQEARELLLAFGKSVDNRYGWKREAADKIGVCSTVVSRILVVKKPVGPHMVRRIRAALSAAHGCERTPPVRKVARANNRARNAFAVEPSAMAQIQDALSSLDSDGVARVLAWANAKFGGPR